ncbi:MAG: hypothetical protein JSS81_19240 [Acidobacteria bacterium]|nr:hypothetical protein [Acidobacteriota bacterium]
MGRILIRLLIYLCYRKTLTVVGFHLILFVIVNFLFYPLIRVRLMTRRGDLS